MITKADADTLKLQLEKHANGSHSHTVGKAEFYLAKIVDKPNAKFSNCTADQFVAAIQAAAYHDQWKELADIMGRWW